MHRNCIVCDAVAYRAYLLIWAVDVVAKQQLQQDMLAASQTQLQ